MTDVSGKESDHFRLVWELPNGTTLTGAGIYDTCEAAERAAADRILCGGAPSRKYSVIPPMRKPEFSSASTLNDIESSVARSAVESWILAMIREFLDFASDQHGVMPVKLAAYSSDGWIKGTGLTEVELAEILSDYQEKVLTKQSVPEKE